MVEADLTYFWPMPRGIDVRILCASTPNSSRTLFELGLAYGHKVSASMFSQRSDIRQIQNKSCQHGDLSLHAGFFRFLEAHFNHQHQQNWNC